MTFSVLSACPLPQWASRSCVAALLTLALACRSTHTQLPIVAPSTSDNAGAPGASRDVDAPGLALVPEFVPPPAPYQPAAPLDSELKHTKLEVRFDYAKQYLYGTATITLRPHFYSQRTLRLDAKHFLIEEVALVTKTGTQPLTYDYHDDENLVLTLDRAYKAGEEYVVRIKYTARPNERKQGGSDAITSDKGLFFINPNGEDGPTKPRQIWTQGETQSNSAWFPTIDRPNQKMTQEIAMTVEDRYKTLSNGLLTSSRKNADGTRTDTWKQDKPHAPYLVMMTVGDFAVIHDKWRNLAVDYYVEPKYAATARAVFGRTPAMMEFTSKLLGVDYAWDKYAQICVRDYVSGAMENTSATLHNEGLQLERRELADRDWDDYIFHELFHHWFGDLVTAESWSNLPLNESFANYSELLWAEHRFGADGAGYIQQRELSQYLSEAEGKQVPLIRYHYESREDMFDSHSYAKGGRVLHMLRGVVGDEAFFASLKLYLTRHRFQSAEVADLRLAFEQVTGQDLQWFFDQWFMRPGHADIIVRHEFAHDTLAITVEQRQDSAYTPIYRLPVKVAAWVRGSRQEWPITVTQATQTFRFRVAEEPELVVFDADARILGTVQPSLSDAEWRYQFFHSGTYFHRLQALEYCAEKLPTGDESDRAVVLAALRDPFWSIRQLAVEALDKFKGDGLAEVRAAVRPLAERDPRSSVRASAISTLASLGDGAASAPLFRQALQDTASSYAVVGAALAALTAVQPEADLGAAIQPFENSENADIVQALADYYASHPTAARGEWFNRQLGRASGVTLYSLTQLYGAFLQKLPNEQRTAGIEKLNELALTHTAFYVRLGAYQALHALADSQPELRDRLEELRRKEKDERVKRFYEMMQ